MIRVNNEISSDQTIEARSDVSLGLGALASNGIVGLGNALSLILAFILRKKVEVLVGIAALLGPVLYLNLDSQSTKTGEPVSLHQLGDIGHDHLPMEGRFVGSLFSSVFEYLLLPLEYLLSLFTSSSVTETKQVQTTVTSESSNEIKAPQSPASPSQTPSHSSSSVTSSEILLSSDELKQLLDGSVADYFLRYEQEIQEIRSALMDQVTGIDEQTKEVIETKYGAGAWESILADITQSAFSEKAAPHSEAVTVFVEELRSVLGEFVMELDSIKSDVWGNVQQYDHIQREILDLKISALHKAASTASVQRKERSFSQSNLVKEVDDFLHESFLPEGQDSAAKKLALLWNIGIQLNNLQTEILQLGVDTVLDDSLASKQLAELSLLEKGGQVAALVLSLSDIALVVEEVRTSELAAVTDVLDSGAVVIVKTIADLKVLSPVTVPHKENLADISNEEIEDFVENKESEVKKNIEKIIDDNKEALTDINKQIEDQTIKESSKESSTGAVEVDKVLPSLKDEIDGAVPSSLQTEIDKLKDEFQELLESSSSGEVKEVIEDLEVKVNSSSEVVSLSPPLKISDEDKSSSSVSSDGGVLQELIDNSAIPAQMSQVVKDVLQSSEDSMKADLESLSAVLFSTPLILDPAKTEVIDDKFGSGAWSSILSSLLKLPASRNSVAGDTKLLTEILNDSIGRILGELESLSHDTKDLMSEINNAESLGTDTKILALMDALANKTGEQTDYFEIPGDVGEVVKAKFAEDIKIFLSPQFLNIDTLKVSLYNSAFEINQLKHRLVDLALSSVLENTSNLTALSTAAKSDLTKLAKENIKSTEGEVEILVMSLFDLTIQLDQAKVEESLHSDTDGLHLVLDKIRAFDELSNIVTSGVDGNSLTSIQNILNEKLLKPSDPLEFSEVRKLFKFSEGETEDKSSQSVYSDLLNIHEG